MTKNVDRFKDGRQNGPSYDGRPCVASLTHTHTRARARVHTDRRGNSSNYWTDCSSTRKPTNSEDYCSVIVSNTATQTDKSSALAETGDRGHNRHGPKLGGAPPLLGVGGWVHI